MVRPPDYDATWRPERNRSMKVRVDNRQDEVLEIDMSEGYIKGLVSAELAIQQHPS